MKLSIIIVNYNVKHFLEQCLKSVEKAIEQLDAEIIVVDNNSVDGSLKMINHKFPKVIVIPNKTNTGFSVANNQGINIAKGKHILLLNPDTVVQEDTLLKCVKFLDTNKNAGALGIKMFNGKGEFLPESKRGLPTPRVAFFKIFGLSSIFPKSRIFGQYHLGYLDEDENHVVEVLSGAFMMIKKRVIEKVGNLDETFFMYGEDIDLSYRITKGGYKNYYFANSNIIHYKGESTKKSSINYVFVFYKAMIIFAKKHFSKNHIKTFSFLINIAIYFRAAIAIFQRIFKKWSISVLEFGFTFFAIYELAHFYQSFMEITFPVKTVKIMIPFYTAVWVICYRAYQNHLPPIKWINLVKGTITGLLILLAAYALLPKTIQFSRAIILLSSILSLSTSFLVRVIFQYFKLGLFENYKKNNQKRLVVGSIDEITRIEKLISYGGNSSKILKISPEENQYNSEFDGSIKQLDEFIKINKIDEVIFCSKDLTSRQIISCMADIHLKKDVEFKIVPDNSQFIIGSQSIYTNEFFNSTRINHINNSSNKRVKRNFDLISSIVIILGFPFMIFFKNYRLAFSKIHLIIRGKFTWIGYINSKKNIDLPKIKQAVFSLDKNEIHIGNEIANKLNIIYAKDYNVQKDILLLTKHLFST